MRLGLYIVALIGCLVVLPALWGMFDEVRFASSARVEPGTFAYYSSVWATGESRVGGIVQGPSRASAGSRGTASSTQTEALYPVFRVTLAGVETEVQSAEPHGFRYFEPGEAVEVLVADDPSLAPRLNDVRARFGDDVVFLLFGLAFLLPAGAALQWVPPDNSVRAARPYLIGVALLLLAFATIGIVGGLLTGEFTWEELLQNRTG